MVASIFTNLSSTGIGLAFVIGSVVFSLLGLFIFKKTSEKEHIKKSSESFVALISIIAILYAVLLAFIVVVAWENYDSAGNNVDDEANMIASCFRDADVLQDTVKGRMLQKDFMIYDSLIYTREWKTMQVPELNDQGKPSRAAKEIKPVLKNIYQLFKEYKGLNTKDDFVYQEIFHSFNKMQELRRARLFNCNKEIPNILWMVILAGTIITLIFTFFFHFENFFTKAVFTSLIAIMMALTMFLIYFLNHPYNSKSVTAEPYEKVHNMANQVGK
jgi:hypothetical protein